MSNQYDRSGHVYILTNPSMPGLLKIGLTTRDPHTRAREISGATGVPTPFKVAYSKAVSDCSAVEQLVHQRLDRYRVDVSREFFQLPLEDAREAVNKAAADYKTRSAMGCLRLPVNVVKWLLLWPVLVPVRLWKHGPVGKLAAVSFVAFTLFAIATTLEEEADPAEVQTASGERPTVRVVANAEAEIEVTVAAEETVAGAGNEEFLPTPTVETVATATSSADQSSADQSSAEQSPADATIEAIQTSFNAAATQRAESVTEPSPTVSTNAPAPPTGTPLSTDRPAPSVPPGVPSDTQQAEVVRVIDGDTIVVSIDDQIYDVHYILLNTPGTDEYYGSNAAQANRDLVEGQTVYLEQDVSETDQYGRLLRYVYLPDGTMVNQELVRLGYAQVSTFPPDVKYEGTMLAAQKEASDADHGLWGSRPTTANDTANLRSGPGTDFELVGGVAAGETLDVTGRNPGGDWYRLANDAWIASFLVDNAPAEVNVAQDIPSPPTATPVPPTSTPAPTQQVAPTATSVPPTSTPVQPQASCDPSYPGVCIAPYPPDLDCGDIPHQDFAVVGSDPHGFDRENDGFGCES